uniref:Trimeric autotransporter adhesin YadA-like head domain-containing protein n=1 Tax=viral metagenome TaxID=1070528 RepID=A0A2V0RAN4_9ZZZZ
MSRANLTSIPPIITIPSNGSLSVNTNSIILGSGATGASDSVVIGGVYTGATASSGATGAVGLGPSAVASGNTSVSIGPRSTSSGLNSICLGPLAGSSATGSIAVGASTVASGATSLAIGYTSAASGSDSIAIGKDSEASQSAAIAVGDSAHASGSNAIAFGNGAQASGSSSIAIGHDVSNAADNSVVIGASDGKVIVPGSFINGGLPSQAFYYGIGANSANFTGSGGTQDFLQGSSGATQTGTGILTAYSNVAVTVNGTSYNMTILKNMTKHTRAGIISFEFVANTSDASVRLVAQLIKFEGDNVIELTRSSSSAYQMIANSAIVDGRTASVTGTTVVVLAEGDGIGVLRLMDADRTLYRSFITGLMF